MSILETLEEWNGLPNVYRVTATRWQASAWSADLRTTDMAAVPNVLLVATQATRTAPVLVRRSVAIEAELIAFSASSPGLENRMRDAISAIDLSRAGTLACLLVGAGGERSVHVEVLLYSDGFSRHSLNTAVVEILKVSRLVERKLDDLLVTALLEVPDEGTAAPDNVERICECGHVNPAGSQVCNQCGGSEPATE